MTIVTKYDIGDLVLIPDLDNTKASVQSIHIGSKGITYEVSWFANGDRKSAYLFDSELTPR